MKTVRIAGERQVNLIDVPDPKANNIFVVVKVEVAPMCTEIKYFMEGKHHDRFGHEAAGEVVDVGSTARVKPGDRVVVMPRFACGKCELCLSGDYIYCQNTINALEATGNSYGVDTYSQYTLKQDWLLLPIPEEMSYEHASMACCGLGPTFNAMDQMKVGAFDTVLITGLGPVGLGGVINAVFRGARVIGVESGAYRAKLARELGAVAVVDPSDPDALKLISEFSGPAGIEKAVDCSGNPVGQRLMIDALKPKGQGCFVGEGGEVPLAVSNDMLRKGLTLRGVWHYPMGSAGRMIRMIAKVGAQLDQLITHRFPLSQTQPAFELQASGECGKVILSPWQNQ